MKSMPGKINPTKQGSKQAFTLIELLVVIAIIAILAAILFPVFAKAREKARQTSCLSNEKQLGLGFIQYENDYDETPPNGVYLYGSGGGGWAGQIYSYVKSTNVYKCPDDTLGKGVFVSYGVNANMGNPTAVAAVPGGNAYAAYPITKYTAVAKTVLLFEGAGSVQFTTYNLYDITQPDEGFGIYGGSPYGNGGAYGFSPNGSGTFDTCPAPAGGTLVYATGYLGGINPGAYSCHWQAPTGRHSDGSNFLMADGHAKWFRGASVSPGSSAAKETDPQNAAGFQASGTSVSTFGATFSIN